MKKVLLMLSLFSALSMCACERAEGSTGEAAQESPEGGTADYDENYTYEGIDVWSESHGGNGLWSLMTSTAYHNPGLYQRDRIVHSETGRQLAEAILFAERYSGVRTRHCVSSCIRKGWPSRSMQRAANGGCCLRPMRRRTSRFPWCRYSRQPACTA